MGMSSLDHIADYGYIGFIMDMRLRFPELLAEKGLTAYHVAKHSGGRISLTTAYRAKKLKGRLGTFDAELLEAMCDIFGVGPGELLEREKKRR